MRRKQYTKHAFRMKRFLFTICLALSGWSLIPMSAFADDNVPKADVLDVEFREDGTAIDLSPMNNEVTVFGQEGLVMYYNEDYKRVVPHFNNPFGGTCTSFYKIDYTENQAFRDALAGGHSLEMVVMADYESFAASEYKPFSGHQGGGTGFLLKKETHEFSFLPHIGGAYRWTTSGVVPAPRTFYHVVGIWNKETGKSSIYVDGEFKGEVDASGEFKFPSEGCTWFAIGGDPNSATVANTGWTGEIAIARIYGHALTAEEVSALYEEVRLPVNYQLMLSNTVDSLLAFHEGYLEGTEPGYFSSDVLEKYKTDYEDALTRAQNLAINGGGSDEDYIAARNEILEKQSALVAQVNPITDGYYNFINAFPQFEANQGVRKAMTLNSNGELAWTDYNPNDAAQLFKVTCSGDTAYVIQSVFTGEYINTIPGQSALVPMSAEAITPQIFTPIYYGQWNIANQLNPMAYHTKDHLSGNGLEGRIVTWDGGPNSCSSWFIHHVVDEDAIAKMVDEGPKAYVAHQLKPYVEQAKAARDIANEYLPCLLHAKDNAEDCQISSNGKSNKEGSYAALIDGDINTYFHATWTDQTDENLNLQFDLVTPIQKAYFTFVPRQSTYLDFPTNVVIYGTNQEELGTNPASSSSEWTQIITIDKGFPTAANQRYTSPKFTFDQPYRYLRMVVYKTYSNRTNSATGYPFFTLSEYQIYNAEPTQNSEYFTVPGMKEACDALDALIAQAEDKIGNLTAQLADTTALLNAAQAVRDLYIDREARMAEFVGVLDSARAAYVDAMGSKVALITNATDGDEACQLSSNAKEPKEGAFANLIDGDVATLFHSAYSEGAGPAEGVYHNLQVDLKGNPAQNFFFEFTARSGSYHETPNLIDVLATNDADLYADAESDDAEWTLIKTIDEPDMPNEGLYKYTSEFVTMDSPYRYLRFVVKHTTNQDAGRVNSYTGMPYFNLSEFQIYTGVDPERVQYNYNPEVKAATDALKALIDAADNIDKYNLTLDNISELRGSLKTFLESFVDTTQLVKLYNAKKNYASLCEVDPEAIACINSEEAVETFLSTIKAARYSIDAKQPTKASVNQAVADINAAYDVLMQSMNKVEPNKWYYIVNKSTLEYCANQAVYLNTTNIENDISFGQYSEGENTYEDDPYAMWRIVPIEGTDYYGIQNMGTAHYFGPTLGRGNEYRTKTKNEPYPFRIDYIGKGQLQLVSIDEANAAEDQIHAQQNGSVIVAWPTGLDGASCWTFKEVDVDNIAPGILIAENSIRIQTLPFDIPAGDASLMNFNDDVKTYAIKSLTTDPENNTTTLELTIQEDVKAGVPFILEYGNYEEYSAENSVLNEFYFLVPDDVSTTATEDNGLIGTLDGLTIEKSGFGYLTNGGLAVTEAAATSIIGQRGYIDPAKVQTREGNTDRVLVLEGGLINGAKPIVAGKATENINVYTIDGKLIKRNVKATDASKGLNKGIYIVGKKKIAVK